MQMQTQLHFESRQTGQLGIERSARKAGETWAQEALAFIHNYLTTHDTLFVDDLWDAGLSKPSSPRALGAVIQTVHRKGWIKEMKHNGMICALPSVNSNMQLKRVWQAVRYIEFDF